VQVRLTGGTGRVQGDYAEVEAEPLAGTPDQMAEELRAYAREGISEVQLVLDPISLASIEEFASVLERLDRAA